MGSRRLRPMTAADLPSLPGSCARCTFWESSLADLAAPADHVDRREMKAEWAEMVTRHWGYCGVMAFSDDEPIGHLALAPAMYVPRLGAFATTPVGPDAAVVMSAHVAGSWCNRPRDSWPAATSGRWRLLAPTMTVRRACCRPAGWSRSVSRWYVPTRSLRGCGWICKTQCVGGLVSAQPGTASPIWYVSRNPPNPRPTPITKLRPRT
jgi:hypothetical protein